MATKTPVYNKLEESFTVAFVRGIIEATSLNNELDDKKEKIHNAIEIARAIADAGLVQPTLINDKRFEALMDQVRGKAEYRKALGEKKEASATAPSEGAAKKAAMQEAVDKKIAEQEATKENPAQADLKPQPMEKVTKAVEAPAPAPENTTSPEDETQWNDVTLKKYAAEYAFIQELGKSFSKEICNALVAQYSQDIYHSLNEIIPANSRGFVAYVKQLQAAADAQNNQAS